MVSKLLLVATLLLNSRLSFAQVYGDYITLRDDTVDMLDFRANAFKKYEKLHAKTSKDIALNGGELNLIHQAVVDRKMLSERIIKYLSENLPRAKDQYEKFTNSELDFYETDYAEDAPLQFAPDTEKMEEKDERSLVRVLGLAMTLADNYLQAIYFYQDDANLRKIINESSSVPGKPGNELKKHIKSMLTRKNVKNLSKALYVYSKIRKQLVEKSVRDDEFKFWTNVIDESFIIDELKSKKVDLLEGEEDLDQDQIFNRLQKLFKHKKKRSDFLHQAGYKIMNALSKAFGNVAGRFQSRDGFLKDREDVIADMKNTLKPLDILLEKTPMRLTDRFIPGYYGHNAIWLGSEEELKQLGLWDHPVFRPLQERIHNGESIVEALRPGVTTNRVEHFLDIDDMAIMRIKTITEEELKKNLIVAAQQYGKAYDFNFDVETQDVLVCSELIFMSFLNIDFRTEKVMGRWTINPDSVAERGRPEGEFNVKMLYTGGKKIEGKLEEKMAYTLAHSELKDEQLLKDFKKIDEAGLKKEGIFRRAVNNIRNLVK
ncbi:MAG: YiiX/YebB-like N1pC/P60 family cysteine hydrolase [Bacteriovoracaceae bacterium]